MIPLLLFFRRGQARSETSVGTPRSEDGLAQAMARETGGASPVESGKISLETPDIAEDGALVPITVNIDLPEVESIWIFVEKNPNPFAARFDLDESLAPFVSLRIKMSESCDVVAMVKSGGEYLTARKNVRVLLGGCG